MLKVQLSTWALVENHSMMNFYSTLTWAAKPYFLGIFLMGQQHCLP